jgi:hypothetical protein
MAGVAGQQKGVVDQLTNTYTDISKMMLAPDAQQHMQFLQGLQQAVMKYLQMQAQASTQAPPGGAMAGMGGPGGGMGAMPPGGPQAANPGGPGAPPGMRIAPGGGAGMSGLMGGAGGGPNPDDLRRLLAQGAQQ